MRRTIKLKPYVIAIILIAVVFAAVNYFIVDFVRGLFLKRLEEESLNYASIYSHSLTKSRQAYIAINRLLESRLLTAISTAALFSQQMTNEALVALAESLSVDEIFMYSAQGIVINSTRPEYMGWEAKPGHPVYEFMMSGAQSLVEEIRKDSESDRYFKYAYLRLDDGRFFQLGISADFVLSFISSFELQSIVDEIGSFHLVDHVCFVSPDFTVRATSGPEHITLDLENPAMREAVLAGQSYSHITRSSDMELYDIYVPVHVDGELVGILVVGKSIKETASALRNSGLLIFVGTSFICLVFLYIMFGNLRHNQQLVSLAFYDSLTGLPNKAYLEEVLAEHLANRDPAVKSAVVLVHYLNLSQINSVYGFDVGDRVMKEVARKLARLAQDGRQLFRFSSNRFVFLVDGYQEREELVALAEEVKAQVERGVHPIGQHLEVRMGIVELREGQKDPVEVLTQASAAVQHLEDSKDSRSYVFFDVAMGAQLRREELVVQELRHFIESPSLGTVYLHYQPKVALATGQVVGFEALARMNSPSLGPVSPAEFIAIAERHGLIVPLGYAILEQACRFVRRLDSQGYTDLHVAVNISAIQLLQEDFVQRVGRILLALGVEPCRLQLEITESELIEDFSGVAAKLLPLKELGVTIALDDFGTGYSALSRLAELAIDCIKIDKHFIDNILVKDTHQLIIQDLISMCHRLGLRVVAEGVEKEEQLRYLKESGCDVMQGYLFSKPLPEEEALLKLAS